MKNKKRESWIDMCARHAKFDILGYMVEKYHQAIIKHKKKGTMNKLQETLWQVAREYVRQFGEVLGVGPEFWIADQPWMCSFGDCYFFTLEEMAGVVDDIDELTIRWGTRERVGDQIREWVDWWMESDLKAWDHERLEQRVTHQLRVNITLGQWLRGCPREGREPFAGPDATYYRHLNERDTLRRLIAEYRENRTLGNVLASVETLLDIDAQEKATRDFEAWEKLIKKNEN